MTDDPAPMTRARIRRLAGDDDDAVRDALARATCDRCGGSNLPGDTMPCSCTPPDIAAMERLQADLDDHGVCPGCGYRTLFGGYCWGPPQSPPLTTS